MFKRRYALTACAAASLTLLAGCMNLGERCGCSGLGSRRANRGAACCDLVSMPCDGPVITGSPMMMSPPVNSTIITTPAPIPQATMPPLAQPPGNSRIVPQPQSQPMPYNPPGTATSRF